MKYKISVAFILIALLVLCFSGCRKTPTDKSVYSLVELEESTPEESLNTSIVEEPQESSTPENIVSETPIESTEPNVPSDVSSEPITSSKPADTMYQEANDSVTAKEEVNLRTGAGTKYDIVATLKSGTFLTRTGIGKNGWSRLDYNGQTVYAVTSYLSNTVIEKPKEDIINGMKFTPQSDRITAKDEVNLRAEPSSKSASVGLLKAGEFLDRTAVSDKGWSRLTYNGQSVYAVTNLITNKISENNQGQQGPVTEHGMEFSQASGNVTAKQEVNLRDKPTSENSNIVYTLKNGEYVQRVGQSKEGWSRLIYNGQVVYAISSLLT